MSKFRYASRAKDIVARTHTAMRPNQINLGGGFAFPDSLPDLSVTAEIVAREHRVEGLQYGPLFGLPDLRDEIAYFLKDDDVSATQENILVTNGAKNALDLILKVFHVLLLVRYLLGKVYLLMMDRLTLMTGFHLKIKKKLLH